MKPPEDVTPEDLFRKLQETPAPSEIVDFPRRGADGKWIFQVRIFVLSMSDHHEARLEAYAWVKKRLEAKELPEAIIGNDNMLQQIQSDAAARFILQKAVRHVNPIPQTEDSPGGPVYPFVFTSAEQLDKMLSAPELEVLFRTYEMVQHKYGPFEGNLHSEADVTAWIKVLGEGAARFPLMRCDSLALLDLSMSLALRAYGLSAALESQHSSLPPTLASALADWDIGTGLYGWPARSSLARGLALALEGVSPPPSDEKPEPSKLPERDLPEVTTENAMKLARELASAENVDDVPEV